jgi:hypothetical protein
MFLRACVTAQTSAGNAKTFRAPEQSHIHAYCQQLLQGHDSSHTSSYQSHEQEGKRGRNKPVLLRVL